MKKCGYFAVFLVGLLIAARELLVKVFNIGEFVHEMGFLGNSIFFIGFFYLFIRTINWLDSLDEECRNTIIVTAFVFISVYYGVVNWDSNRDFDFEESLPAVLR